MFGNLKKGIRNLLNKIKYRELDEILLREVMDEFELILLENELSLETVEYIRNKVLEYGMGLKIERRESPSRYIYKMIENVIEGIIDNAGSMDLLRHIKYSNIKPFKMVFLGVNGVGKTTTIAKIAYFLKTNGFSLVLSCSDTFRAASIEQLAIWAKRIGVKMIHQQYGADPAAVAYDAVNYAISKGIDCVLIDTAGRQHSNINLMDELKKIARVVNPDLKILVIDSLTGNDAVIQARDFHRHIGVDAVIFTKVDADVKGGAILSVLHAIKKPVLFLSTGQDLDQLMKFEKEYFINQLLGGYS